MNPLQAVNIIKMGSEKQAALWSKLLRAGTLGFDDFARIFTKVNPLASSKRVKQVFDAASKAKSGGKGSSFSRFISKIRKGEKADLHSPMEAWQGLTKQQVREIAHPYYASGLSPEQIGRIPRPKMVPQADIIPARGQFGLPMTAEEMTKKAPNAWGGGVATQGPMYNYTAARKFNPKSLNDLIPKSQWDEMVTAGQIPPSNSMSVPGKQIGAKRFPIKRHEFGHWAHHRKAYQNPEEFQRTMKGALRTMRQANPEAYAQWAKSSNPAEFYRTMARSQLDEAATAGLIDAKDLKAAIKKIDDMPMGDLVDQMKPAMADVGRQLGVTPQEFLMSQRNLQSMQLKEFAGHYTGARRGVGGRRVRAATAEGWQSPWAEAASRDPAVKSTIEHLQRNYMVPGGKLGIKAKPNVIVKKTPVPSARTPIEATKKDQLARKRRTLTRAPVRQTPAYTAPTHTPPDYVPAYDYGTAAAVSPSSGGMDEMGALAALGLLTGTVSMGTERGREAGSPFKD